MNATAAKREGSEADREVSPPVAVVVPLVAVVVDGAVVLDGA